MSQEIELDLDNNRGSVGFKEARENLQNVIDKIAAKNRISNKLTWIMAPVQAAIWWDSPIPVLGGMSPNEMLNNGKYALVETLVDAYIEYDATVALDYD